MKTKDILILGGAILGGYLLAPKSVKDAVSGVLPSNPLNFIPSLNISLPAGGDLGKVVSETAQTAGGVIGAVTSAPAVVKELVTRVTEAPPGQVTPGPSPTPSPEAANNPLQIFPSADAEGLKNKIGIGAGIGIGLLEAFFTKGLASIGSKIGIDLAVRLGIKGASTALKFVPWLGWAYAAADAGTTAYELITGKNVAGSWLGWGELFNPTPENNAKPSTAPDLLTTHEGSVGLPEASTVVFDNMSPERIAAVSAAAVKAGPTTTAALSDALKTGDLFTAKVIEHQLSPAGQAEAEFY